MLEFKSPEETANEKNTVVFKLDITCKRSAERVDGIVNDKGENQPLGAWSSRHFLDYVNFLDPLLSHSMSTNRGNKYVCMVNDGRNDDSGLDSVMFISTYTYHPI